MLNQTLFKSVPLMMGLSLSLMACGPEQESNTVSILGVVIGEQQEKLEKALAPFEEETGIDVVYEGTDSFATLLPVRVDSGKPPDIAMFPQPGLMADFAKEGLLIPIDTFMEPAELSNAYSQDWLDLSTINNQIYGVWYRASVKSLVWYSPKAFDDAGYKIPTTWDEMLALTDQIVADGGVPWCLGMESGAATGWVGTDWVEDIMLRTAGPQAYDQWLTNELPFDDPLVKNAFTQFGDIVLNPDYVVGGYTGAISTPFGDSPKPLFTDPPGCYMHRQANFIASFFPKEIVVGEDVSIFPLPGIKPEFGVPVLVAGDVFAMFNDTPEAQALMKYLASAKPHEVWASLGGYISPHQQVGMEAYTDAITQKQAEILSNADIVRFDGSDMMPGAVGTGTFWTGITDYVGGNDLDAVLDDIQASWPK
ncbi:MAG: ABC transporter substrate-binding protein [Leptolyngbyaceae cyanobacterium MO_188.B28]|nr:ABC transporter substrate-binding protein [Leptolyngbyaceae cyanobacterium MO_188.B28]